MVGPYYIGLNATDLEKIISISNKSLRMIQIILSILNGGGWGKQKAQAIPALS